MAEKITVQYDGGRIESRPWPFTPLGKSLDKVLKKKDFNVRSVTNPRIGGRGRLERNYTTTPSTLLVQILSLVPQPKRFLGKSPPSTEHHADHYQGFEPDEVGWRLEHDEFDRRDYWVGLASLDAMMKRFSDPSNERIIITQEDQSKGTDFVDVHFDSGPNYRVFYSAVTPESLAFLKSEFGYDEQNGGPLPEEPRHTHHGHRVHSEALLKKIQKVIEYGIELEAK